MTTDRSPGEALATSRFGGWRARVLVAAGATLAAVVLAGVFGEVAVRYRERTRATVPGTMSQMFYRHQRLMHGLVRGFDYYGWVHISQQGFRGAREVSLLPGDSVVRIIAMGGSTTFDGNVSGDSSTWPARLEEALNATPSNVTYEVLNAGVPGFEVFDNFVRLPSEVFQYRPAVILLYHAHNNLFNSLGRAPGGRGEERFDARPFEIPTVYPWERWLERRSLLYHKLRSRFEAIRLRWVGARQLDRTTVVDFDDRLNAGVDEFARHVRAFLAVAQSLGIEVVVPQVVFAARSGAAGTDSAIVALWRRGVPFAPPEVVWNGYGRFDSVAQAAAADFGAVYLPADSALWSLDLFAAGDPIHFNDDGARRFAAHLAAGLREIPAMQRPRPAPTP